MSIDVTWFQSSDPNAPQLDGTAGSLIAVLDACLLTGYGTVNVSALSVTDGLATATVDAGHGFTDGCVVEIAGANEAAFNGRKRMTRVSATQFTFDAGAATGTATGTITAKRAPLAQWEQAFTGTDKAAYRSTDPASVANFLVRFDNTGTAGVAGVSGYESMSDIDTGSNQFGNRFVFSNATAWRLFGDSRAFYLRVNKTLFFFGEPLRFDAADGFLFVIAARHYGTGSFPTSEGYLVNWLKLSLNYFAYAARDRSAGALNSPVYVDYYASKVSTVDKPAGGQGPSYAPPLVMAGPALIHDVDGTMRGIYPGLQVPAHALPASDGTYHDLLVFGEVRKFQAVRYEQGVYSSPNSNMNGQVFIDLTGPWR